MGVAGSSARENAAMSRERWRMAASGLPETHSTSRLGFQEELCLRSNPPIRELRRRLDVVEEIDFAPAEPFDRQRPDFARRRQAVDDLEVPVLDAFGRAHRLADGFAEQRGPFA